MLSEGTNWRHFPAESDTLTVFYAPVKVKPPTLPHYKRTARLTVGRLLINAGTNEFYQDCRDEIRDIVAAASAGYRRTIHYGFSQGATGALDSGLSDPKCVAIFAFSPHFILDRPFSRSAMMMSPEVLARPREDMLDRIRRSAGKDLHIFLSCEDPEDGTQVRDAQSLAGSAANVYFLSLPHFMKTLHVPEIVVPAYVETGKYSLPPDAPVADATAQRHAIIAFDVRAACLGKTELSPEVVREAAAAADFGIARWLSTYLVWQQRYDDAMLHAVRACAIGHRKGAQLYDHLVAAGNLTANRGMFEVALGYYRQARRIGPRAGLAWLCEANLLSMLKRPADLTDLARQCAASGTDAAVARKLAERAAAARTESDCVAVPSNDSLPEPADVMTNRERGFAAMHGGA